MEGNQLEDNHGRFLLLPLGNFGLHSAPILEETLYNVQTLCCLWFQPATKTNDPSRRLRGQQRAVSKCSSSASQLQGSSSTACYFTVPSRPLTLIQVLLPHLNPQSGDISIVTSLSFLPMHCKFPTLHHSFSHVYVYVHTGTCLFPCEYVYVWVTHAHGCK